MPRKLGELGCSGPEARARLKRLIEPLNDPMFPFNDKQKEFVSDMAMALKDNPNFEPSFGQVTYAQDLYDRYVL